MTSRASGVVMLSALDAPYLLTNNPTKTTITPPLAQWSGIPLLTMLSNVGLFGSLAFLVWALVSRALSM